MSDETTPQGDAAMSPASTGSVGAPAAWEVYWAGAARQPYLVAASEKPLDGWSPAPRCVPLYRSPALTDAERKAISRIYDLLNERSRELQAARRIEESTPFVQLAKTLQAMWERLG